MSATPFIVCGWYTTDYRKWWNRLRENLENIGAPHDFVERPKLSGGWEINTMRKPHEILAALERHPDTTIIFLDVDCIVRGRYEHLTELASIPGDVGFYLHSRWRKREKNPLCEARSGTIVVRPTALAKAYISAWCKADDGSRRFAVDQHSMMLAIGRVAGLSITCLDLKYCATLWDQCPDPIILHDSASVKAHAHTNIWKKRFHNLKQLVVRQSLLPEQ